MTLVDISELAKALAKSRPDRDKAVSYQQWLKDVKAISQIGPIMIGDEGFSSDKFVKECLE